MARERPAVLGLTPLPVYSGSDTVPSSSQPALGTICSLQALLSCPGGQSPAKEGQALGQWSWGNLCSFFPSHSTIQIFPMGVYVHTHLSKCAHTHHALSAPSPDPASCLECGSIISYTCFPAASLPGGPQGLPTPSSSANTMAALLDGGLVFSVHLPTAHKADALMTPIDQGLQGMHTWTKLTWVAGDRARL